MIRLRIAALAFIALCLAIPVANAADDNAIDASAKVLGDPNAPVTIIEYASLSCPHCAKFHAERLPWLKESFIETGRAKLEFRDFPLNAPALMGAMLAHCAGSNQYLDENEPERAKRVAVPSQWRFHDCAICAPPDVHLPAPRKAIRRHGNQIGSPF